MKGTVEIRKADERLHDSDQGGPKFALVIIGSSTELVVA